MNSRIFNPFRSGISAAVSVLTLGSLAAPSAFAKTLTWDGGGPNGQWNQAPTPGPVWANWVDDAAFATGDDIVFGSTNLGGAATLLTAPGGSREIKSLTFQSGSPAYDIRLTPSPAGTAAADLTFNTTNTGITVAAGDNSSHIIGQGAVGGNVVLLNNLTVTHNGGGTLTFSRPITGSTFGLTKDGAGTMKLDALNTYDGATNILQGNLWLGAGSTGGVINPSSTITISGGATFTIARSNTATQGTDFGLIAGAGNLAHNGGPGITILNQANSYSGVTTVLGGAGRLEFSIAANGGSNSSLGSSSNAASNLLLANSSTLRYIGEGGSTDRSFTINGTGGGNQATLEASGSGAISFTNTASPAYYSDIANINQSRVLILSGSNTGDNTLAANIANNGSGAVQIRKTGAGKWILSGTSAYTGKTDIQQGVLEFKVAANGGSDSSLGKSGAEATNLLLGNTATLRYTGAGGSTDRSFTINGTAAGNQATLDASGSGAINFTNTASPAYYSDIANIDQSRILILGGTNTGDNTLAANIANNGSGAVQIRKTGAGKWILSGTSTYSGRVDIQEGVLEFKVAASAGTASSLGQGAVGAENLLLGNNTTLRYTGTGHSTNRLFTINGTETGDSAILDASGSGAISFTNPGSLAYGTNNQTRTLTLTGTNTGTNQLVASIADNGSGAVQIEKNGSGTWRLAGTSSTYSGNTTVSSGTLELVTNSAAGTGAISLTGATSVLRIYAPVTGLANAGNDITVTNASASIVRQVAVSGAYSLGTGIDLKSDLTGGIDTTAQILSGTNAGASVKSLTMSFSTSSTATNDSARRSDIFNITNTGTDTFVVQLVLSGLADDSRLAFWNTTANEWQLPGGTFYADSWNAGYNTPGQYGFDTTTDSAWAVVNNTFTGYNGSFAVIPEPTSALGGLLLAAGLLRRRRA